MSRRAVILAGGKGTRLRPYTVVLPKPLMPIGDFPILEVIIRQLVFHGFNHVTLAVNHQADIIRAYFKDGKQWGITIDYSLETSPLGTMGPLRLIKDLPENFLVMNGDILTDLDFSCFHDKHIKDEQTFSISCASRVSKIDYGVIEIDESGFASGFREKPALTYSVSMGIYMLNKRILDLVPPNTQFGFDGLVLRSIDSCRPPKIEPFEGYWLDIGRPDDYIKAIEEFEGNKKMFLND